MCAKFLFDPFIRWEMYPTNEISATKKNSARGYRGRLGKTSRYRTVLISHIWYRTKIKGEKLQYRTCLLMNQHAKFCRSSDGTAGWGHQCERDLQRGAEAVARLLVEPGELEAEIVQPCGELVKIVSNGYYWLLACCSPGRSQVVLPLQKQIHG